MQSDREWRPGETVRLAWVSHVVTMTKRGEAPDSSLVSKRLRAAALIARVNAPPTNHTKVGRFRKAYGMQLGGH